MMITLETGWDVDPKLTVLSHPIRNAAFCVSKVDSAYRSSVGEWTNGLLTAPCSPTADDRELAYMGSRLTYL